METATYNGKTILTAAEAAEYLGLSRGYIYNLTSQRRIPHSKPAGKIIYFSKDELDKWALRNRIQTVEELSAEALSHIKEGRS